MRAELWREARDLFRTYGARGIALRGRHELERRAGLFRSLEPRPAFDTGWRPVAMELSSVRPFFVAHPASAAAAVERAEEIAAGRLRFFQGPARETGWPPRWLEHSLTGAVWPGNRPWFEASTTDLSLGDIKWIWEPARLGFAWSFARAAVAGDDAPRWWDELWRGLDDFLATCPPYQGPNWYCAQEAALRILALEFAFAVFAALGLEPSPPQRRRVEQLYADTGRRIAATLGHSLSQRNNHAISELVGLWAVAIACPNLPDASAWRRRVARELPPVLADQFADDGAYIQESLIYQRFALHLLLLLRWLCDRRGVGHPAPLRPIFESSSSFLSQLTDQTSGQAPNYGANDGTLLLPLSDSSFRDFRPLLAHLGAVLGRATPLAAGNWDEERAWLSVAAAPAEAGAAGRFAATQSGYVSSSRGESLVFMRVPAHTHHRPSHADALHVDLFAGGRNILLDPGTYAYTAAPPWDNGLARTRVHNTASVADFDQMRRRGRFLWTRWTRARLTWTHESDELSACMAQCDADSDGVVLHRRLFVHCNAGLWVFDALEADRARRLRVHWNLEGSWHRGEPGSDAARLRSHSVLVSLAAAQPIEVSAVVGDADSTLGWASPTYGQRVPCTAVELESRAETAFFRSSVVWGSDTAPGWLADVWSAWTGARFDEATARIERH